MTNDNDKDIASESSSNDSSVVDRSKQFDPAAEQEAKPKSLETNPESESGVVKEEHQQTSYETPDDLDMERRNRSEQRRAQRTKTFQNITRWLQKTRYGLPLFVLLVSVAFIASAYVCWWLLFGQITGWANEEGKAWRWIFAWFPAMFLGVGPFYVLMGAWPIFISAINSSGNIAEKRELDELDIVESEIRGSNDPVDYARYSRKALRAYYLMGQNQVRLSFYVGVAAMIFGFIFLVAGLVLQAVDTSQVKYLRDTQEVSIIVVGGGVVIEFIAATFLWVYRTAIVQLNLYYRRQTLIHSALISVAVAKNLEGDDYQSVLKEVISTVVAPNPDVNLPELPKTDATKKKSKEKDDKA
jgi:hypothetical protein